MVLLDLILMKGSNGGDIISDMSEVDMKALWDAVINDAEMSGEFGPLFNTFWKPTRLVSVHDNTYTIEVVNIFAKTQFEQKYENTVRELLKKNGANAPRVNFVTIKSHNKPSNKYHDDVVVIDDIDTKSSSNANKPKFNSHLNPKYRFDNFIVGSCNDLAYAAAQAAAKQPGEKYNPIFIYGGAGLGKTHLIQAIGNEIAKNDKTKKVLYATTEEFTNDYIYHITNTSSQEFTNKYRNLDVLIVDDIQFISGKDKTQEAFFNTFNALHQANKQIIISSDRPPGIIPTLTDRLKSRFQMGMTIDVSLPDYETRVAIIEAKAKMNSAVNLPAETAEYIAKNVRTNIRELEGALNQVMAYAEMKNITPTAEFASEILASSRPSQTKHITARQIIEKTAKYFEIKTTEIKSSSRSQYIILPRQIAMYLLRSELHMSYPQIAHELGRSDHTTAMHSITKVERQIKLDITIREKVDEIRELLYA